MVKKTKTRFLALVMALVLALSLLPAQALAITPDLSESRPQNAVRFGSMHFWTQWLNGAGAEWFVVPFDAASGSVMFCVDPGVASSTNPANYRVYVGNGSSKLSDIMALAQSDSALGGASGDKLKEDPPDGISSDVLDSIPADALEWILQDISVLHESRGVGIYGPPTHGEAYNVYDVYAVQCLIWYLCNPRSNDLWAALRAWPESEQHHVTDAFEAIERRRKELYGSDRVTGFSLDSHATAPSQGEAEAKVIPLPKDQDEQTYPVDDPDKFGKIQYVCLDGQTVQPFREGDTARSGPFSLTNNGGSVTVKIAGEADETVYTARFLTEPTLPENAVAEDWVVYAQAGTRYQSFFTAYRAPRSADMRLCFKKEPKPINPPTTDVPPPPDVPKVDPPEISLPGFAFFQHKLDSVGGFDGDACTPVGDASLGASFTLTWRTDLGASGSETAAADLYGHGASEKIFPWGFGGAASVTETQDIQQWQWYTPPDEGEGTGEEGGVPGAGAGEGEEPFEPEPIEFTAGYTWTGSCTVTVTESGVPAGRDGNPASYTHTVTFFAHTERETPLDKFSPVQYTVTVDGRNIGLSDDAAIKATWEAPFRVNESGPDTFVNRAWTGSLQIIKTRDNDDIFDVTHGQGTVAGGAVGGAEYSTGSRWTLRLVSRDIDSQSVSEASRFQGYENCPYVKVAEDPAMQGSAVGRLMHCYKVLLDGSGTPADDSHPLTPSGFGQIYVSGLPYGTYLLTEYKADADRYVKESMFFTIGQDNQVVSTSIHNSAKENVVRIVKVDAETGKTVPSAGTAFRIRYLGSPEYTDPTQTPNYGRYLPNAADLNAGAAGADDYIFFTDAAGEVIIPYALPYGSYQVEEILVPDGYYIGRYGEDGKAGSAGGTANAYGPGGDNTQTTGPDSMAFDRRVSIYNAQGERVDYTRDEAVVYQYYTFEVTKQADHVDGGAYQTYELTVELANTPAKGAVQVTKLGERLSGWKETVDGCGNTVMEPVYTQAPVEGVTFGIYAAEDVLLEDGEEPPRAYDKLTGEELELVTEVMNHVQFPGAERVRTGVHKATGAEVVYRIQRQTGENNYAYVDYLTPTQRGTAYTLNFSRHDDEAGLTYDYEIRFELEYSAGGWNYTDIHVARTITADDYTAGFEAPLPHIWNGGAEVDYSRSQTFDNQNRLEVLEGIRNEYDLTANAYEVQVVKNSPLSPLPVQIPDSERWARLMDVPELPEGYGPGEIRPACITASNGAAGEELALVQLEDGPAWVRMDELGSLSGWTYCAPRYSLEGITLAGAGGEPLDFAAYGCGDVTPLYAKDGAVYVTRDGETCAVYFGGAQALDGTIQSIDSIVLVPDGEEPGIGSYNGPDPAACPLPEGYEYIKDRFGAIMAHNEQTDGWMVFVREGDVYRWIPCDRDAQAYRVRRQSFAVSLVQHNASPDGWRFEMDGIGLTSAAADEDTATAVISVPYPNAVPQVTDYMGSETGTEELEGGGTRTSITIRHPTAPVDFAMIDGTRAELVYLGGYTKTTVTIPAENALPTVTRSGQEVDWFDRANGGLTPEHPTHEVLLGGGSYTRAARHEAEDGRGVYYTLELVSDAQELDGALIVDYHGAYRSAALSVTDAATGAGRGDLRFFAIYKTLRYPLSALVETITTGTDGVAVSSPLPLGNYVVRELSAPNGLVSAGAAYPFTLAWRDQFTPLVWTSGSVENSAVSVQLDITKGFQKELGSEEYEAKAGAVFGVYTYEETGGLSAGTLVATVTTGADGKALETVKLPQGAYYVQELRTLDGYELNDARFLFRAEDSVKSGALAFSLEELGMFGKITHSGYKTAEVEITAYAQIPMPGLSVNGLAYDLTEELAEGTVGSNALVRSAVSADRTVFTVTAVAGSPVTITFANGASLRLEVGETGYTAAFTDAEGAAVQVEESAAGAVSLVSRDGQTGVYAYDPLTAFTGYTAQAGTIYTPPRTVLTGAGGTTLAYAYDLARGVKLAAVTWPEGWRCYEELPLRDVSCYLGDLDRDGDVDGDDLALLTAALEPGTEPALTEDQRLLADLDGSGSVDGADLEALAALVEGLSSGALRLTDQARITLREPYLPDDAITFDTAGFGNAAYIGAAVDPQARTMTIDLSRFDFDRGPYRIYVGGDTVVLTSAGEISLEGETVTARNSATGKTVPDGYQPDGLTLTGGNTLISRNRTLALSSYKGTDEVRLELAHDHSYALLEVTRGGVAAARLSGAPLTVEGPVTLAPGNSAVLLMEDGAVYHVSLSNTGYAELSVEDIVPGAIGRKDIPLLLVNGSADNFVDTEYRVITQRVPMDAVSLDDVREHNTQSVTLARSDGSVKQLQVKINAVGAPEDQTGGIQTPAGDPEGGGVTVKPIENDVKPYISKVSATTGKELAGAQIEIYDAQGNTVAAGESDANGKFYFEKPAPGTYTFREISAPEGYQLNTEIFTFVVHPNGDITGDNTVKDEPVPPPPFIPGPSTVRVSVEKVWVGDSEEVRPREITVQLLLDGLVYAAVTLSEENGWSHTWTGLPQGKWTVAEPDVPEGYTVQIAQDGRSFTVTNTYEEEPEDPGVDVSVRKVWAGDGEETRPQAVTAALLLGGEVYDTVTLSEENGWSHTWTGLPQGDWTVSEPEVPEGYTSAVERDGWSFTITNTRDEDVPETPPPLEETPEEPPEEEVPDDPPPLVDRPDVPQTGDFSPAWCAAAVLSACGLALLKRKKEEE